jgi:hypothetical protein
MDAGQGFGINDTKNRRSPHSPAKLWCIEVKIAQYKQLSF